MFPTQVSPVIYTPDQIEVIAPQIDELTARCDELLAQVAISLKGADQQIQMARDAEQRLQAPLRLQNKLFEAKQLVNQLKRKAGLAEPHPVIEFTTGHCTIQGKRPSNEDAHVLEQFEHCGRKYTISAVFDGHAGDQAAKYCSASLVKTLIAQDTFPAQPKRALESTFVQMDADFGRVMQQSGCTATCMLFEHGAENCVYTANAGDARILLRNSEFFVQATEDHKPSAPAEAERIRAAGSFVQVLYGVARVAGQLAVSRAIGDFDYKCHGVTARPDTYQYVDLDGLDYVLLACDGLYDVLSNDEIDAAVLASVNGQAKTTTDRQRVIAKAMRLYCNLKVKKADDLLLANGAFAFINFAMCKAPTEQMGLAERMAVALTRVAYILGSMDNITAIVLLNKKYTTAAEAEEDEVVEVVEVGEVEAEAEGRKPTEIVMDADEHFEGYDDQYMLQKADNAEEIKAVTDYYEQQEIGKEEKAEKKTDDNVEK